MGKKRRLTDALMAVVGHIMSNPQVVSHCFAGEVKYLTPEGWVSFADTVGTEQMVLSRTGGFATWVPAHIHPFGEQKIWEVHLRRNQRTKVIRTTDGHRWLSRERGGATAKYRDQPVFKTTVELRPGDRLDWCLPVSKIGQSHPSPVGIMHGFVYGDGSRAQRGSKVTLWGEKDAALLPFFASHRTVPAKTPNGVDGVTVVDLPGYFKDRPSLAEATHYLLGFLSGWFAADGSVDAAGQVTLCSASLEDLEFAQQVGLALGIASYDIVSKIRSGYVDGELHSLTFIGSTLKESFFLIPEHRERWMRKQERSNPERIGWTVERVVETDAVEEVFCAVVPGPETFTIEGFIHTGNCPFCGSGAIVRQSDETINCTFCDRSFLVMEQPKFSAAPGDPNAVPPAGGLPSAEQPDPGVDPTAPDAPGEPPVQHSPVNPQTDPDALASAPPFKLGSARIERFAVRRGVLVGEDDFATHLAFELERDLLVAD